MTRECTELFVHYRELARIIWNLGFWRNSDLRQWDVLDIYRETTARLFEGLVLLALGYQGRIRQADSPGEIAEFLVRIAAPEAELWVDRNTPEAPGHVWGSPTLRLTSEFTQFQLRFVRFFDWDKLAPRDLRYLEVLIERLDDKPELVGHHALVEFQKCSIWFVAQEHRKNNADP
jgi:hypothetical protein